MLCTPGLPSQSAAMFPANPSLVSPLAQIPLVTCRSPADGAAGAGAGAGAGGGLLMMIPGAGGGAVTVRVGTGFGGAGCGGAGFGGAGFGGAGLAGAVTAAGWLVSAVVTPAVPPITISPPRARAVIAAGLLVIAMYCLLIVFPVRLPG